MRSPRLLLGLFFALTGLVEGVAAAPDVSYSGRLAWNDATATLTFLSSGAMPDTKEGFFWNVPPSVKRIVIEADVRVTGGFRVRYRKPDNSLRIEGRNRETSVIFGTSHEAWTATNGVPDNDKWRYSAVSIVEDAVVHVSHLTVMNPRGYLISGYATRAVVHVDSCSLLDTRRGVNNNSDGFAGAKGSSVRRCLISTGDDGIKVYNDITIHDVTIEQHRNGAPLQFGWGGESPTATAVIRNLVIRGMDPENRYNMAPLSWERGNDGTRNVTIDGLDVIASGEMYDEEAKRWQPLGLLEIKPRTCVFNLTVTRAALHGLPLGVCNSAGTVSVATAASP